MKKTMQISILPAVIADLSEFMMEICADADYSSAGSRLLVFRGEDAERFIVDAEAGNWLYDLDLEIVKSWEEEMGVLRINMDCGRWEGLVLKIDYLA